MGEFVLFNKERKQDAVIGVGGANDPAEYRN